MKELWKSPKDNNSLKDFKSTTLNPNGGWGKGKVTMTTPGKKSGGKSKDPTLAKLGF